VTKGQIIDDHGFHMDELEFLREENSLVTQRDNRT